MSKRNYDNDQFCRLICTGRDGWTSRKRKACRETGLCQECRLLVKANVSGGNCGVRQSSLTGTARRDRL